MIKQKQRESKKIYILDTNVLLHDPQAMFKFQGATVGIPIVILEELDQFKREGTERGRNSRQVIRQLDELRMQGNLSEGVPVHDGEIIVLFPPSPKEFQALVSSFDWTVQDNKILLMLIGLKKEGYEVHFISKDINARVRADAMGIQSADYEAEYITPDEFYRGWRLINVPANELKDDMPRILPDLISEYNLITNEFVVLQSANNPFNFRVFRHLANGGFKSVQEPDIDWPLRPRNVQQLMACDLLFDEDIQFVALFGPAGTGKTFLALLAGLYKVLVENEYEKMLVSRPVVPLGRDIGFLPGDIREKLHSWMLPIYDNVEFIAHAVNTRRVLAEDEDEEVNWHDVRKARHKSKKKAKRRSSRGLPSLDELAYQGKVSLEAITYMRGRSIPFQFILIDEVQNLTPHEIKTIVSRAGQGSKIVLAGDPYQIDSPYLDFSSNGLVIASERFKGQPLFGTVYLDISERSLLSKLASDLL